MTTNNLGPPPATEPAMPFQIGDHVIYATGGADREISFARAVVVEVDARKRIGIAIPDVIEVSTDSRREGDRIVSVTVCAVVWTPKRVAAASLSHTAPFEVAAPTIRSVIAIPPAWR